MTSEDPELPGQDVPGPQDPESVPPEPERVRTGVPAVDQVIAAVEELEDRPLEEHVGVFETAHEQLRRALDPSTGGTAGAPAGADADLDTDLA